MKRKFSRKEARIEPLLGHEKKPQYSWNSPTPKILELRFQYNCVHGVKFYFLLLFSRKVQNVNCTSSRTGCSFVHGSFKGFSWLQHKCGLLIMQLTAVGLALQVSGHPLGRGEDCIWVSNAFDRAHCIRYCQYKNNFL